MTRLMSHRFSPTLRPGKSWDSEIFGNDYFLSVDYIFLLRKRLKYGTGLDRRRGSATKPLRFVELDLRPADGDCLSYRVCLAGYASQRVGGSVWHHASGTASGSSTVPPKHEALSFVSHFV